MQNRLQTSSLRFYAKFEAHNQDINKTWSCSPSNINLPDTTRGKPRCERNLNDPEMFLIHKHVGWDLNLWLGRTWTKMTFFPDIQISEVQLSPVGLWVLTVWFFSTTSITGSGAPGDSFTPPWSRDTPVPFNYTLTSWEAGRAVGRLVGLQVSAVVSVEKTGKMNPFWSGEDEFADCPAPT